MLFGHQYVFFGEMSTWIFCPFFHWVGCFFLILRCMSCLYILEINSLLVASFENNFFYHSEGYLFVLFMVSFAVQKILSLICFHLFLFIFITLGHGMKNTLLQFIYLFIFFTFTFFFIFFNFFLIFNF